MIVCPFRNETPKANKTSGSSDRSDYNKTPLAVCKWGVRGMLDLNAIDKDNKSKITKFYFSKFSYLLRMGSRFINEW